MENFTFSVKILMLKIRSLFIAQQIGQKFKNCLKNVNKMYVS